MTYQLVDIVYIPYSWEMLNKQNSITINNNQYFNTKFGTLCIFNFPNKPKTGFIVEEIKAQKYLA